LDATSSLCAKIYIRLSILFDFESVFPFFIMQILGIAKAEGQWSFVTFANVFEIML
jgi:hypothetical protein